MQVAVGDTITMRDWIGEWIDVRVNKLGKSPTYGDTVEGNMIEDGMAHKFVALPLDHLVEKVTATNIRHGKWELTLPDGSQVYVASKAKAKEFCEKNDFVLKEG